MDDERKRGWKEEGERGNEDDGDGESGDRGRSGPGENRDENWRMGKMNGLGENHCYFTVMENDFDNLGQIERL